MTIENGILKHYLKNVYFITGTSYAGKSTTVRMLSEKYGMDLSSLCRVYNKGVIDGLKEQQDPEESLKEWLCGLIGRPEKAQEEKQPEQ